MLNNDNWINSNDHMPEEDEYVLVILRHTYPGNYWEYDIARNIVLHDKPYWCSSQYGYLEHPRYSTRPYRVVAWHELPKVPNWAIGSKENEEV